MYTSGIAYQAIANPVGVSAFGSAVLRVVPDLAVLRIGTRSLQQQPDAAFAAARAQTEAIRAALRSAGASDVATSRISLRQEMRFVQNEQRFVGYGAQVSFEIIVRDLDRVEPLLVTAVAAGANEISSVDYQTTKLREYRTEARQLAIGAAREKARVYCDAAGVKPGRILHIEDVSPDSLTGNREGHAQSKVAVADNESAAISALDPSSIIVAAAVLLVCALQTET
jgi:uncharacterized protein YggE